MSPRSALTGAHRPTGIAGGYSVIRSRDDLGAAPRLVLNAVQEGREVTPREESAGARRITPGVDPCQSRRDAALGAASAHAVRSSPEAGAPLPSAMSRGLRLLADRPVLLRLRGWQLSTYGAAVAAGFAIGVLQWTRLLSDRLGTATPGYPFVVGTVLSAFAGSRALAVLQSFLARRLDQHRICTGGHTFYGGIFGALTFAVVAARIQGLELPLLADAAAPAIALGFGIGKLGCLAHGCCIGRPTAGSFFVHYRSPASKAVGFYGQQGVRLLPAQVLESLFGLAVWLGLSLLPPSRYGFGSVFGAFLVLTAVGRMLLLRLRYRHPDEESEPLLAAACHAVMLILGILLVAGGWSDAAELGVPSRGSGLQAAASAVAAFVAALTAFALRPDPTRSAHEV